MSSDVARLIGSANSISGLMTSFVQNGGAPKAHKLIERMRKHLPRGQRVKHLPRNQRVKI